MILPQGRSETLKHVKFLANGDAIYKWIARYAYARNGNLHNPTPEIVWERHDAKGRIIGTARRMKDLL